MKIAAYEGFLLGSCPTLDLSFESDGFHGRRKLRSENQGHRASAIGPGIRVFASIVFGFANGGIIAAKTADVVATVSAQENVDPSFHDASQSWKKWRGAVETSRSAALVLRRTALRACSA
jgi:hypothetical protein